MLFRSLEMRVGTAARIGPDFATEIHSTDTTRDELDAIHFITQKISDALTGHVNRAYTNLGDESCFANEDLFRAGFTIEDRWIAHLQPVFEVVSRTPVSCHELIDLGVNTGVHGEVRSGVVLDAPVGTRLAGNWPDLTASVGYAWVFL